jgi:hypothetical protein
LAAVAYARRYINFNKKWTAAAIAAGAALLSYWPAFASSTETLYNYISNPDSAMIKVKKLFGQPISDTDYYGTSIGRYLLGFDDGVYKDGFIPKYLSQQLGEGAVWTKKNSPLAANYNPVLPFPIYTAVQDESERTTAQNYHWFEFTPYQIGTVLEKNGHQAGMFVKTWAFGRRFLNGHSVDYAPEQSLDFYLGIFSSAMNANIHDTASMVPGLQKIGSIAKSLPLTGFLDTQHRFTTAKVLNPMYGMKEQYDEEYIKSPEIGLIDAGLSFNLPYPPLNDYAGKRPERKPDVIIFIDASADAADVNIDSTLNPPLRWEHNKQAWPTGNELRKVATYAHTHGLNFPDLPNGNLASERCKILSDENSPVVIYIPLTKVVDGSPDVVAGVPYKDFIQANRIEVDGKDFTPANPNDVDLDKYQTKRTNLSPQDSVNLITLMRYNVRRSKDAILEAIRNRQALRERAHQ